MSVVSTDYRHFALRLARLSRANELTSAPPWWLPSSEILTVGLPFCVFKIISGVIALSLPWFWPAGYALIALGVIDLLFNAVNLGSLLFLHRRATSVCLSDLLVQKIKRGAPDAELGLALDVFLSFALVALVVGAGGIGHMSARELALWNTAVVLNVLGAGIGRLMSALRR